MKLSTKYKPENITSKQASKIGPSLKQSVDQIVEETSQAREELIKMRIDLAAESSLFKEKNSKNAMIDLEVVSLIKELQIELNELNEKIDQANSQIREKEIENFLLKQNISQILTLNENQKYLGCPCPTF